MKIPPWLKDKRVQLGMAGAAVAGVVVLAKKGTAASADGDGSTSSGQPLQAANYDSTGTDVYNAISSATTAWDDDLRQFTDQLTDIQTQLGKINGPTTGTGTGTTTPAPKPKPAPVKKPGVPKPKPVNKTVKVEKWTSKNTKWDSTLSGIAGHYHTSVSHLLKLNPSVKSANSLKVGQKIRYK